MSERDLLSIIRIKDEIRILDGIAEDFRLETFIKDERIQRTVSMSFISIGENINRLSDEFKEKYAEIPWSQIVGLRNIAAHGYWALDMEVVWKTLVHDILNLRAFFDVL
ncbi:MAG: DUF86 domain-containing protein [Defluviitaleaceae bacterium]|nr:DUF86 domain-containing protein [Defluviitaleaceae bacterium]